MTYKNYFLFGLLIIVGVFSCCKDEAPCDNPTDIRCPNYDPCLLTPPANADFFMVDTLYENWADTSLTFDQDTFRTGDQVIFKAADQKHAATYQWQVGLHSTMQTVPIFDLLFNDIEETLTVRLTTTAKDEYGCLTEAESKDTEERKITFISEDLPNPIFGSYTGELEGESRTVVVYDSIFSIGGHVAFPFFRGFELPGCEPIAIGFPIVYGYDYFISNHKNYPRCRNLTAIGRLHHDDRDIFEVYYTYDGDDGKRKRGVFVAHRQ